MYLLTQYGTWLGLSVKCEFSNSPLPSAHVYVSELSSLESVELVSKNAKPESQVSVACLCKTLFSSVELEKATCELGGCTDEKYHSLHLSAKHRKSKLQYRILPSKRPRHLLVSVEKW